MCYNGQKQRGHISEEADQLSIEGTGLCGAGISHVLDCGAERVFQRVSSGSVRQSLSMFLLILSRSLPAARDKGTALQVSNAILLPPWHTCRLSPSCPRRQYRKIRSALLCVLERSALNMES